MVYLSLSNEGLNIIELSKKLRGNEQFVNYILEKYKNTPFDKLKYKLEKPTNITDKLSLIKFPKSVISAKLVIKI